MDKDNKDAIERETDLEDEEVEDEVTQTMAEDEIGGGERESAGLEAKVKELEEKYLRTYADFENYRKRVAKEKEEVRYATSERLLKELLEVKDHLELAISHTQTTAESPELKVLQEGVELTLKQLENFLKKFGVEEIKAVGQPFNPEVHEAIQQEESDQHAPGAVVRVYQKGYTMNGRLLRATRVTVAKEKK